MIESAIIRSLSYSLPAKCFTVQMTPAACAPRTIRGRHATSKERVLGVGLEVAATQRRAMKIHGRGEKDAARLGPSLLPDELAYPFDQFQVPGGAERGSAWDARCGHRLFPVLSATEHGAVGTVGAIGQTNRRNAVVLDRDRRKEIGTGQKCGLFVDVEPSYQRDEVAGHGIFTPIVVLVPRGGGTQVGSIWRATISMRGTTSRKIAGPRSHEHHRPAVGHEQCAHHFRVVERSECSPQSTDQLGRNCRTEPAHARFVGQQGHEDGA